MPFINAAQIHSTQLSVTPVGVGPAQNWHDFMPSITATTWVPPDPLGWLQGTEERRKEQSQREAEKEKEQSQREAEKEQGQRKLGKEKEQSQRKFGKKMEQSQMKGGKEEH